MNTAKTFNELKISNEVKNAIKEMGLSELFPIQEQTIPRLLEGEDLIGQAQTGTGKTIAFGIPIIEKININMKNVQALILTPTRELAVQVSEEIKKIGKYKGVKVLPVYGGVSIDQQIRTLKRGIHVVVGTPGRILDHLERRTLNLSNVSILVLDEADRMLDMGFVDDIRTILEKTPKHRQTLLFSATMPEAILFLAKDHMKSHELVSVSKDELTVKDTEQVYCEIDYYSKIDAVKKIIADEKIESAIIFCNTKKGADNLADILRKQRYQVAAIHGNLSQARRNKVITDFKSGRIKILVATDVAARGLDIKGVSHVINYNIPHDPKDYVHRIGRTGRAGKIGKAITFVTDRDKEFLSAIEWYLDTKLKKIECDVPKRDRSHRKNFRPHQRGRDEYRGSRGQRDNRRGRNRYAFGEF